MGLRSLGPGSDWFARVFMPAVFGIPRSRLRSRGACGRFMPLLLQGGLSVLRLSAVRDVHRCRNAAIHGQGNPDWHCYASKPSRSRLSSRGAPCSIGSLPSSLPGSSSPFGIPRVSSVGAGGTSRVPASVRTRFPSRRGSRFRALSVRRLQPFPRLR